LKHQCEGIDVLKTKMNKKLPPTKKLSPKGTVYGGDRSVAGKIFFLIFFLLILGSVAATYWRIVVKRDYIISAQQECDPAVEVCFVSECDPEDPEDLECAGLPEEERITYYKIIKKNAKNIPLCDPYGNECPKTLECGVGEAECEFEYCTEENVPEGEECSDPETYNAKNPQEDCECGIGEGEEAVEDNSALSGKAEADEKSAAEEETANSAEKNSEEGAGTETGPEDGEKEEPACDCAKESSQKEENGDSEQDGDNINSNDNLEDNLAPQQY